MFFRGVSRTSAGFTTIAVAALGLMIALAPVRPAAGSVSSRLVVIIVVDQFRYDFLRRYAEHFVDGGFNRFRTEGASFTQARYRHATTDTCPGHAVISTGTWGYRNGIVANTWFDAKLGKRVECSEPNWRGPAGNLLVPTIGDMLEQATEGGSKVISVSGKRAAAVVLGGLGADAVYWQSERGGFVSATKDRADVPAWVANYNDSRPLRSWLGKRWDKLLPDEAYADTVLAVGSSVHGEAGVGSAFPQSITDEASAIEGDFYSAIQVSPFPDEVLANFVITTIREEGLGQDDITDLLTISFSSTDRVGHRYGPDSAEMLDTVVRLDRLLKRLLDSLNDQVGLEHTIVVLTSDHGVAPLPEVVNMRAGEYEAGRIAESRLAETVNDALDSAYGKPGSGTWVVFHDFPNVYLNEEAIRSSGAPPVDVERMARRAVASVPGVKSAFTRTELTSWRGTAVVAEPVRMALRNFRPDRSGHVVYQVLPLHVVSDAGTNHGSHWDYDTHVPLMWLGPGVKPGRYSGSVSPSDIAPTLLAMLGISASFELSGCVLNVMLHSPGVPCDYAGY
jgi:predicted AlkP superfamily pyrophosphatase or phosphodiesterase